MVELQWMKRFGKCFRRTQWKFKWNYCKGLSDIGVLKEYKAYSKTKTNNEDKDIIFQTYIYMVWSLNEKERDKFLLHM